MSGSGTGETLAGIVGHSDARHAECEGFAVEAEAAALQQETRAVSTVPALAGLLDEAMVMVATTQRLLQTHGQDWSQYDFVTVVQNEMASVAGQIRVQIAEAAAGAQPAEEDEEDEEPPPPRSRPSGRQQK